MARRDRLGLTAVRTEGAILPPSILARIHREDMTLGGLKAEDYGLSGTKLREAASQAWNSLQGPWRAFQGERANLAPGEAATAMTRRRWLDQVLKALDYGVLEPLRESLPVSDRDFPISHRYKTVPIHLVGCGLDLDKRTKGAVGAATSSPHGLVQLYLNADDRALWGFVSNGLRWRVLRDSVSLSRQAMVEFDLEATFEGQLYSEFLLFFLVCHQSRVQADRPEDCWLEKWSQTAGEEGKRALNTLRNGVEKAIEALGQGFLRHPDNRALRERIRQGSLDKQDYYRQLLRMVYRLLFLFVAEDRGLLLHPNADESARRLFSECYGTQRLRILAERLRGSRRHHDLFVQFKLIVGLLSEPEGCPELGLPALGGFLFSEGSCPDLDAAELSNADLLDSIRRLAVTEEDGRRTRVDYKNLASEEMGSVYESLLELHPDLRTDGSAFRLLKAPGNDKKTSGSYYTPDSLVQCLLETALDPVVADAIKKAGTDPEARETAILAIRVIDPAVGSGHFLIAASHRLAKRLAQVRSGDDEPSPSAMRHALRDVIGKCLYGIDLNPMAAELCKVALWMEALEPGRPLSFLDHHVVIGNALFGTTPELIAQGIPDAAYDSLEGDDTQLREDLKKRNRAERSAQGDLFDPDVFAGKSLLDAWSALDDMPDATLDEVRKKAQTYRQAESALAMRRTLADTWCAAFVVPRVRPTNDAPPVALTTGTLRRLLNGSELSDLEGAAVREAAARFSFLHPAIAFPDVFAKGGFDVVLANPPWEKIKVSEKEFFAAKAPEIAEMDKAGRNAAIKKLKEQGHPYYQEFLDEKGRAAVEGAFLRRTGGYPLTATGDMNLYALFAERICGLIGPTGRAGFIVPTELATNFGTSAFFSKLVEDRRLVSVFDFENGVRADDGQDDEDVEEEAATRRRTSTGQRLLFPDVDSRYRFALFTVAGTAIESPTRMASMLHRVEDLRPDRVYELVLDDIRLMNPNTGSAPMMRSARHAEIVRGVYRRWPVLVDKRSGSVPWRCTYDTQFHMSNDREEHFVTETEREVHQEPETLLPLYEAKMMHHYDHRWGTYAGGKDNKVRDVTEEEKTNPRFGVTPRYWVDAGEVERRHDPDLRWVVGWRDITNPTNARTTIATALPRVAFGNKVPLLLMPEVPPVLRLGWLVCANSFALDFVSRQKIAGVTYNKYLMEQMPFPTPEAFLEPCPWDPSRQLIQWLAPRVVDLCYSAHDMVEFARDVGVDGPPFGWDEERRRVLRAELDAAAFRLYGIGLEDAGFVMESFPSIRRLDLARHGSYRTRDAVLTVLSALIAAEVSAVAYASPLDPPPAHGWEPDPQTMPSASPVSQVGGANPVSGGLFGEDA